MNQIYDQERDLQKQWALELEQTKQFYFREIALVVGIEPESIPDICRGNPDCFLMLWQAAQNRGMVNHKDEGVGIAGSVIMLVVGILMLILLGVFMYLKMRRKKMAAEQAGRRA